MKQGFRQSMAWLHGWAGLVVGWILFAVFVTGTASYYREPISRWMRPDQAPHAVFDAAALARAADVGGAYLAAHAAGARNAFIGLPSADRPVLDVFWRMRPGETPGRASLDPETGAPAKLRDTKGGDFFYRFHFELHMAPIWGRWVVGVCAFAMLVALISGIVTHRRIFADLFTFRRDKAAQRSWLDAHNVTGVLALPFHLMITYTGLVTLALMYMPWGLDVAYKGDRQTFFAETGQIIAPRPPAKRPEPLTPLGPLVARALEAMPGETLERLTILNPGDANATVTAVFEEPHGLTHQHPQIAFDGVSGAEIGRVGALQPAARTYTVFVGLHEGHFAGPVLRVLFFLCGLLGTGMVATGLVLWTVSRLPNDKATRAGERPGFGLRLVEILNVGTIAGMPAGIAAYFLANRLLPAGLEGRADWEIRAFFGVWVLTALACAFRARRRAWASGFGLCAALYLAVPIVSAVMLWQPPFSGSPLFVWFDVAMLALAAVFALAARKIDGAVAARRGRHAMA